MKIRELERKRERAKKVQLKLKTYGIVSEAVESGIAYGYQRAHKYGETPGAEHILDCLLQAIMNELSEVVDWEA